MKGRPFNSLILPDSNLDCVERDRCQIAVSVEMKIRRLYIPQTVVLLELWPWTDAVTITGQH